MFVMNNIKAWNFKQIKITIMDHRRLAELLTKVFPKDYKIYFPASLNEDINEFLTNLYELTPLDYHKLLETLDATSKTTWWKTIQIRYQKYMIVPIKINLAQNGKDIKQLSDLSNSKKGYLARE